MITNNSLSVTIHLRDKTTKEFIETVCNGSGDNIDMKSLSKKLSSLQTQVNTFLTELVEQERETTQQANTGINNSQLEDDIDDEDDDDDEDTGEPPLKQQKT